MLFLYFWKFENISVLITPVFYYAYLLYLK